MHDSMLLLLHPAKEPVEKGVPALSPAASVSVDHRFGTVGVSLGSPNMLLLDMAEYSFNGGDFYAEEELLRLDNNVRQELGIPIRRKEVVQAYLLEPETYQNFLRLRFRIASELPLSGLKLALEEPALAEISLNGEKVEVLPDGFYVDRDIRTVPLPDFKEGENILELKLPVGRTTNLEYFYLLGSFGVRVNGTKKTLTAPVSAIGWGDIVAQGLPFYTGTISYFVKIRSEADFTLRVPHYTAAASSKCFSMAKTAEISPFRPMLSRFTPSPESMSWSFGSIPAGIMASASSTIPRACISTRVPTPGEAPVISGAMSITSGPPVF